MSASINLVGLDRQMLCNELKKSEYFLGIDRADIKERILNGSIGTSDFIDLFYYLARKGIADAEMKRLGMEIFFEVGIKRYCFELAEMFGYYFQGFRWDTEVKLEHPGPDHVLQRSDALGVMRWFDALSCVFGEYDNPEVNRDYLREATEIKTSYQSAYEYFSVAEDIFRDVDRRLLVSDQRIFLWAYSF